MKPVTTILYLLLFSSFFLPTSSFCAASPLYPGNRPPLISRPYIDLPLGSIKPRGWLLEMLNRQRTGATSQMDTLYPEVMGARNGWLGGDGDQWERGPYWIDGLLPLAYILDDQSLIAKTKPWIEWTLASQRPDGFFGPAKNYKNEPDLQRNNSEDWWPRMVVLKILQQYYSATNDPRVIPFLTRYFQYQLKTLPQKPLGNWTFWATYRVGDNIQVVYWLYNITGDAFLLDLADLLYKQGYNYSNAFLAGNLLSTVGAMQGPPADPATHCVNIAQGMKEPIVYSQQHPDPKYAASVHKALADLRRFHGTPQGMYGADEALHGANPTQGSELCSAVELMFSLESMLSITGDPAFADHLERIAFNALPAQITDDFMAKQYFQQANQVAVTRHVRNFNCNYDGTDIVFGTLTGYPCCFSNMHQGWPKFTQNLWYATPDAGLAALIYSPSEVTAKVSDGRLIKITEDTAYPMDDKITFTIQLADAPVAQAASLPERATRATPPWACVAQAASLPSDLRFPLRLRIPSWCNAAAIKINGVPYVPSVPFVPATIVTLDRPWRAGDIIELTLPMEVTVSTAWYDNSVAVERGPLVYALRLTENWTEKKFPAAEVSRYGEKYYEVTSPDKWNYGLLETTLSSPSTQFKVLIDPAKQNAPFFWNVENAPIQIRARAREIPTWTLYNEMTGLLPRSLWGGNPGEDKTQIPPETEITLIPYGCTTLRISEFPVVK